jgi:hypothetical protein
MAPNPPPAREAGADTPSSVSRATRAQRPARAGWAAVGRRRQLFFVLFRLGADAGGRAFAANADDEADWAALWLLADVAPSF